jgi:predicted outer membrane protein
MLARDHAAAIKELKAVAQSLSVTLPESSDPQAEESYRRIGKKTGEEFDAALLNELAAGHSKSIERFEAAEKIARSAALKAFIDKYLPVLRRHAEQIRELEKLATPKNVSPSP